MNEIYIIHLDWEGSCLLNNNKIYRRNYEEESGNFTLLYNKLVIYWENWNSEIFYYYDNNKCFYFEKIFLDKYTSCIFFEKNMIIDIFLNKEDNDYALHYNENILKGTYILENEYILLNENNKEVNQYKNIDFNLYCLVEDLDSNYLFDLIITNNSLQEKYIFNKNLKTFYSTKDINNNGKYIIVDNSIIMEWSNGYKKKFYSNKYISNSKSDITIIIPKKIIIDNKILFSNISLCGKNIILTSIYYRSDPWNINDIEINVKNQKIINKKIFENDDYEASFSIIIEIDKLLDNLYLEIKYKDLYKFDIFLEQLKINDHKISAMTLFKDDYYLLERYLKYYSNMGVELFFLYYNKKIDSKIIDQIIKLNQNNVKIYLIEWNHIYWWKYYDLKHHYAQTMAINDSLHIMKNYGEYLLYNDLDEYIKLDNYCNLNSLIKDFDEIDTFIFKNRFCKMGNNLIKFEDFDKEFDFSKIIKGNYWDKGREKNLIKLKNINVMGVHYPFKKFSNESIIEKVICEFYHIINFKEKYREELMTQYIT